MVGILAGYSLWSDTASVVTIVEQTALAIPVAGQGLDRRVQAREEKLGVDSSPAARAKAY